MTEEEINEGLEGIVVAKSSVSNIDGEEGRLWYRGYTIEDLAEHSSYEEVTYLLLNGELPTQEQLSDVRDEMASKRELPPRVLGALRTFDQADPMEALRTGVSMLGEGEPDLLHLEEDEVREKGLDIISKLPTITAAHYRIVNDEEPVEPDEDLGHGANFLYMLRGEEPDEVSGDAMDNDFLLHADHGFNASTFTARTATSTMSDIYSAITAAICTLRGPYHGGASAAAMEQLEEVGEPEKAEEYVRDKLEAGERLMGFGHRVYRVKDPRAKILGRTLKRLAEGDDEKWPEIQERMEEMMAEKDLYANVDFYSATVYRSLGIPTSLYTPLFALGRVTGWVAHVLEQAADNRLIRPLSEYEGELDKEYVKIEDR